MRAQEFLVEYRRGLLDYLKKEFPTWPDYIVYDFLYKMAKGMTDQAELQDWLQGIKKDYGNLRWTLKNIPIKLELFTPDTQRRFKERGMGTSNPYGVPKDAERHATQQAMIAKQGVSKEPIIVIKTPQGLDLLEGWHRTIQHLRAFPQGYTGPAWIGQ